MDYKEKVKNLPSSPGVYIMKGDKGDAIYVGKAGNLKKRVSSYFYPNRRIADRTEALVAHISDISYIQTSTEAEALIYENSLIKQFKPRYNVALKDDKSYPFLKLTLNEKFPRLFITRQKKNDGSAYYGPYTDVKLLREAIKILRQKFPLRTCSKMPKGVCLNYHIKQCIGPCVEPADDSRYGEIVSELKLFLEGKREELLRILSERMAALSLKEKFEEAAEMARRIDALAAVRERAVSYAPLFETAELKDILGINGAIEVIEAFDVSNIMGEAAVGSMVLFYNGRPKRSEYRKFKIKTITGVDDYAMIREVVRRRYSRRLEEKKRLPDLILIDGGKGHLASASGELEKLGLSEIPVAGIAKEFEHIYLKGRSEAIVLPRESKALHLLERIRDEAHRFAINYHKGLRSKKISASELDDISGIGDKRKRALLEYFKSVEKIKAADKEEILKVKGMNEKSARNIIEHFKR